MLTGNAGVSTATPAGQPASSANAGLATEATTPPGTPAIDAPMPLAAETANNAGAPATSAPLPATVNDTWLRRMERAIDRGSQWLQSARAYMPDGRDIRPRNQRRTESPASVRSGNTAISERDMLHAVFMVNTDGQMGMRADGDTVPELAHYLRITPIHIRRISYSLDLRKGIPLRKKKLVDI
eukprot:6236501-Pyramimonas_sp.AAC.1